MHCTVRRWFGVGRAQPAISGNCIRRRLDSRTRLRQAGGKDDARSARLPLASRRCLTFSMYDAWQRRPRGYTYVCHPSVSFPAQALPGPSRSLGRRCARESSCKPRVSVGALAFSWENLEPCGPDAYALRCVSRPWRRLRHTPLRARGPTVHELLIGTTVEFKVCPSSVTAGDLQHLIAAISREGSDRHALATDIH